MNQFGNEKITERLFSWKLELIPVFIVDVNGYTILHFN